MVVGTDQFRILIVEDERDLAAMIRAILEEEGYTVAVHPDGDCLDAVRRFQPDVILCDYMLPTYSGRAVVERIRHEISPLVPIVLISATEYARQNWQAWKADAFVSKPFDIDDLLEVVEQVLEESRFRDEDAS